MLALSLVPGPPLQHYAKVASSIPQHLHCGEKETQVMGVYSIVATGLFTPRFQKLPRVPIVSEVTLYLYTLMATWSRHKEPVWMFMLPGCDIKPPTHQVQTGDTAQRTELRASPTPRTLFLFVSSP